MEQIKIRYIKNTEGKTVEKLKKIQKGDLIDLRSAEHVTMKKGEYRLIPLGVAMQLPEGYEAHIYPRSSTFKNFKLLLTNSVGIVDQSYCGNDDQWRFPAYAMEDTEINFNDRICQFRIVKNQPEIEFEEVEELTGENRGGIGSTGVQ